MPRGDFVALLGYVAIVWLVVACRRQGGKFVTGYFARQMTEFEYPGVIAAMVQKVLLR